MTDLAALREWFGYEPDTGLIRWLKSPARCIKAGDEAGSHYDGYLSIQFEGRRINAHRLAWTLHYGKPPTQTIDHLNGDRADNRISNLRDVSLGTNSQNRRRAMKNNKLGIKGVRASGKKFVAVIVTAGKNTYLGTFPTAAEAHAAYIEAKRVQHVGNTL